MNHSFNCDVAKEVGVVPAVILENMSFWLLQKRANNQDFENGNWWVYNSVKAWLELFPYLTTRKIRTAIETLIKEGFVIEGDQNKKNYDRTKWYAMTEKAWKFYLPEAEKISDSPFVNSDNSTCQERQKDLSNLTNRFVKNDKPIPIINTYIDTDIDINPPISPVAKLEETVVERIFEHWKKTMKSPWSKMSDKRRALIRKWLKTYSPDDLMMAITGCSLTAHNMGDNDRGQRYNSIELILRDAEHIERFIANSINPPRKKSSGFADYFANRGIAYEQDITPDPVFLG